MTTINRMRLEFVSSIVMYLPSLNRTKVILNSFFRSRRRHFIRRDSAQACGAVLFGESEPSEVCDPSSDAAREF